MNLNDSAVESTDDYSSYWASIPDPPTHDNAETLLPQRNADDNPAGRRRNRRGSTAPLKDVTNASVSQDGDFKGKTPSTTVLGLELESDSEDEDKLNKRSKRSRKRRSLLLPSDDGIDTSAKSTNSSKDQDAQTECINSKHNQSLDPEEIVHLVRKYCSLPLDRRLDSQESKQIELLSSYPMPGKFLNIFDKNNENSKREFMLRAQPMVNLMEEQKRQDILDAKSFTRCEVKKGRGGFEYLDLESGDTIDAEEYRVRYCAMIDERRAKRIGGRFNVEQSTIDSNETSPYSVDDSNMDMDESTFTSPDDSFFPDEKSAVSNTNATGECLIIASSAREHESSTSIQNSTTVSSCNPSSNETTSTDVPPHPLLGSMPPSDDPRVLEARRKLFRSIDSALATYSREILALTQDVEHGAGVECTKK